MDHLDRLVGGTDEELSRFLDKADPSVEAVARRRLAELPIPLRADPDGTLARERAVLHRIAAELAARRGEPEELEELLYQDFRAGRAQPWIRYLAEHGQRPRAATTRSTWRSRPGP